MKYTEDPYIQYVQEEDKERRYTKACDKGFIDPDGDFLVGDSGGFLWNIGEFSFTNTHLFREAALTYEKEGVYIKEKVGSLRYDRFREQEEYRRKNGYEAYCKHVKGETRKIRITGDMYNFINYGQMLKLDTASITAGSNSANKIYGIPEFLAFQYWYTKSLEFAKANNYHNILLKPRRSGITYIESTNNANIVNITPKVTVIHAASDKKYLLQSGGITTFSKTQLDYYETDTPFVRDYLSEDMADIELGYKPEGTNIRKGYRSKLITVSFGKDAMAAAGKDAIKISVEELSNAANLKDFLDLTLPTTRTGAFTTGLLNGWGTGGAKEANWEHFEEVFNNPTTYDMMPYENIYEGESRNQTCGMFKSYIESLQGIDINPESSTYGQSGMDEDGNSNYEVAHNIAMHERAQSKKNKKIKEYLRDIGQYCRKPSEAFTNTGDNMFVTPDFTDHVNDIRNGTIPNIYWDGTVIEDNGVCKFKSNDQLLSEGHRPMVHPYIEDVPFDKNKDIYGCLRMYQPPLKEQVSKTIPMNLYRIWHDPFGVEKDKDQITNENSLTTIVVYMRDNNLVSDIGDKIVAVYRGRPDSHKEVNSLMYRICKLYNAKIQFENERGQVQSDFKAMKALNLLEKEPNVAWDNTLVAKQRQNYGMSIGAGTGNRSLKALDYMYEWLHAVRGTREDGTIIRTFHYIKDLPTLLEILRWGPKKNLDIVSALKIGMFDAKEVATREIKTRVKTNPNRTGAFANNWFE